MNHMFDLYPQPDDYIPNNRIRCFEEQHINIMVGETSSHTFRIPFNVEEDCTDVKVIYKVGINVALVKEFEELEIDVESKEIEVGGEIKTIYYTLITDTISPDETLAFADTLLDTFVQLRFTMKEGIITYSEIYPVSVRNSLDSSAKPKPIINSGF